MRVLVISNSPWDDSSSFGSTFSNFFQSFDKNEVANICCVGGSPNTQNCGRFFRFTESSLFKTIIHRIDVAGEEVFIGQNNTVCEVKKESKFKTFVRKHRWTIFFWARELLWKMGKWKGENLDNFIKSFKPEIIVLPTYSYSYVNKLAIYIQDKYNLPMVSYVSDDEYTLKQFSLSPLYWINRLYQRRWVKRVIERSKILYCISNVQKQDYEKCFSVPCKILTKSTSFDTPHFKEKLNSPLRMVFTGNIGSNRWRTLAKLAKSLKVVNKNAVFARLEIYTGTPTTRLMRRKLNISGSSQIMGKVSASEVKQLQNQADLLVHVEATDLKNKLLVRQSFSTKLVDYFSVARAIFAIGPKEVASIRYLEENESAIVATNRREILEQLNKIKMSNASILYYASKAYQCGKKNHSKENMQSMLINDLNDICIEKNESITN